MLSARRSGGTQSRDALHCLAVALLLFFVGSQAAATFVAPLRRDCDVFRKGLIRIVQCPALSKAQDGLANFLSTRVVNITCPQYKDIAVMKRAGGEDGTPAPVWCTDGWSWRLYGPSCVAHLSPFEIATLEPAVRDASECLFENRVELSLVYVGFLTAGLVLFLFAPQLSKSTAFRMTVGSLAFASGSAVILLFVLWRALPARRTILAAAAALGGSLVSIAVYLGTNLSLTRLLGSPWILAYISGTAALGASVTYYFDDTGNVKLNNIITVALRVIGLALILNSTSIPEAAWTLVAVAAALPLVPLAVRALRPARPEPPATWKEAQQIEQPAEPLPATPVVEEDDHAAGSPSRVLRHSEGPPDSAQQAVRTPASGQRLGRTTGVFGSASPSKRGGKKPTNYMRRRLDAQLEDTLPATPSPGPVSPPVPPPVSPLVQRGKIVNVATGREIKLDGATYQRLVDAGHVPDFQAGTLTPPPSDRP